MDSSRLRSCRKKSQKWRVCCLAICKKNCFRFENFIKLFSFLTDSNFPIIFKFFPISDEFSWFFENITRREAEKYLLAEENPQGTFLIRPSERSIDQYALSIKDWEIGVGYQTRHYKIQCNENMYYITKHYQYPTLQALVAAYRSEFDTFHVAQCPFWAKINNFHFLFWIKDFEGNAPGIGHKLTQVNYFVWRSFSYRDDLNLWRSWRYKSQCCGYHFVFFSI